MSRRSLLTAEALSSVEAMDTFITTSDNDETPKASRENLDGIELLSTSTQSASTSTTGCELVLSTSSPSTASTATTALPSPELPGPAANFGIVTEGSIYRSSFPKLPNFEHMRKLGLKTVLTLVTTPYPVENQLFISDNNIMHVKLPIPAHKDTFDSIPLESMERALSILSDPRNYPVLVHCNKGKHRTGCVIGCYRKMNGWSMDQILDEYRHYAGVKARPLDEKYMGLFDDQSMKATINCGASATDHQAKSVGNECGEQGVWKSFPHRAHTV